MSFLGGLLGGAIGFVTGGPLGAVTGAAAGLSRGGLRGLTGGPFIAPRPMLPQPMMPFAPDMPGGMGIFTMPMGGGMGVACPPGTACSGASSDGLCIGTCRPIMGGVGGMMGLMGRGGACPLPAPRGTHWNKKTYCTVRQGVVPACTKLIRNRRLNPANGRAARRAVRRIAATHKLLKRIEKSIRRIKGVRQAKLPRPGRGVRGLLPAGSKEVIVA